jgi:hypothetical protein
MSEEVKHKVAHYTQWNVIEEAKIEPNVMKIFEVIYFKSMKIQELDFISRDFEKLKILDLSNNFIKAVENTPPNLEELYVNSNDVQHIRGPVNKNLLHLGLAYNHIDEYLLNDIYKFYPCLFSLNVSHNKLINLEQAAQICTQFGDLKILVLQGNPCCLVEGYKPYCINKLRSLRLFDTTPIPKDDAKKKRSMKSDRHTKASGELQLNNDISFDLEISVLGGVTGVKLTEEHFEDPTKFEELEAKNKCSRFWVQIDNLISDELVKSDVKLWDTEFMKEEEVGKTDFKLSLRRILKLIEDNNAHTAETVTWNQESVDAKEENKSQNMQKEKERKYSQSVLNNLLAGLWIELYEEYPVIAESTTEEGETINRVALDSEGKPMFKTAIRGMLKINTENWILNPNLNSTDLIIHNKFYFYKLKYKTIPEFFYENHSVSFKNSEIEAIDIYVKAKREKIEQQEAEDREKAEAEKSKVILKNP